MDSLNIRKRTIWPLWIVLILFAAGVLVLGQPRTSPGAPLDLSSPQGQVPVLRNQYGEVLLYNFRGVEPRLLYRSSGFPRNGTTKESGKTVKIPAAYEDDRLFKFLKQRNIKTVVTLQDENSFWAEQGYFEWWQKRDEHKIEVISLPVKNDAAYTTKPDGALRAASRFLDLMKQHKSSDGAVLIHDEHGKDAVGVAVALYELWRNQGKMEKDKLWSQVRNRYLASNKVLGADGEVSAFAGPPQQCNDLGDGQSGPGFVCGENLDKLRSDLELLAQL